MKDKLRRFGWLMLVILFLVTGLGVGIVSFWQSTHQNKGATTVTDTTNQNQNLLKGTALSGFTPAQPTTTLQKTDLQVGTGAEATSASTVTVNYTGAVAATGVIFESSLDSGQPVTFGLNQVIKGWGEGVPGMKVGGQRRLLIPAALAYGGNPPPGAGIPANADLVFDISLLDVK